MGDLDPAPFFEAGEAARDFDAENEGGEGEEEDRGKMRLLLNRDLWFPVPEFLSDARVVEALKQCKMELDIAQKEQELLDEMELEPFENEDFV